MNKKLTNILRWLGVFPAFVAGIFAGALLILIITWLNSGSFGFSSDSGWAQIMANVIGPSVAALFATYFGARTAPAHRRIVSMVLAAFIVIMHTLNIMVALMDQLPGLGWYIFAAIGAISAAGYVVFQFFEEGDEFQLF